MPSLVSVPNLIPPKKCFPVQRKIHALRYRPRQLRNTEINPHCGFSYSAFPTSPSPLTSIPFLPNRPPHQRRHNFAVAWGTISLHFLGRRRASCPAIHLLRANWELCCLHGINAISTISIGIISPGGEFKPSRIGRWALRPVGRQIHARKPMKLGETDAEIQGVFVSNPMTPIETSWYFLPPKRGLEERFDAAKVSELGRYCGPITDNISPVTGFCCPIRVQFVSISDEKFGRYGFSIPVSIPLGMR